MKNQCEGCNAYGYPGVRPHANVKNRVEKCDTCNLFVDDEGAAIALAVRLGVQVERRTVDLDGLPIKSFFVKGVPLSDNDKFVFADAPGGIG